MVTHASSSTLYSVHEFCSPGRCMRILQPVEQWKSLQFQLQSWWELCLPAPDDVLQRYSQRRRIMNSPTAAIWWQSTTRFLAIPLACHAWRSTAWLGFCGAASSNSCASTSKRDCGCTRISDSDAKARRWPASSFCTATSRDVSAGTNVFDGNITHVEAIERCRPGESLWLHVSPCVVGLQL